MSCILADFLLLSFGICLFLISLRVDFISCHLRFLWLMCLLNFIMFSFSFNSHSDIKLYNDFSQHVHATSTFCHNDAAVAFCLVL